MLDCVDDGDDDAGQRNPGEEVMKDGIEAGVMLEVLYFGLAHWVLRVRVFMILAGAVKTGTNFACFPHP